MGRTGSLKIGQEIDLVGVVVEIKESSLIIADRGNNFVTISVRTNWKAEALDTVIALKSLLAFQNVIFRKNSTFSFEPQYSEVFANVSEFSTTEQKRTPLFKKFNSFGTLLKKTGSELYLEAYTKSKENISPNINNSRQNQTSLPQVKIKFF